MGAAQTPEGFAEACDVACSHCGLSVPLAALVSEQTEQFCCAGCRGAFLLIHAAGLGQYYALRTEDAAAHAGAVEATNSDYVDYDTPAFTDLLTALSRGCGASNCMCRGCIAPHACGSWRSFQVSCRALSMLACSLSDVCSK
jgi:hypothetical protein